MRFKLGWITGKLKGCSVLKLIALVLLVIGFSVALPAPEPAPEIDPASGANALALIAGVLVLLRARRKK